MKILKGVFTLQQKNDVIIIGAGTAGLTLSIFLKKAGIDSTIYERDEEPHESGAGFIVTTNGIRVLEHLGLVEKVHDKSSLIKEEVTHDKLNNEVEKAVLYNKDSQGQEHISITRYDLCQVLLEEAERMGVSIVYGKELVNLQQDVNSVTGQFDDESEVTGKLLVGADGSNSNTRERTFYDKHLEYRGLFAVQGLAPSQSISEELEGRGISYVDSEKEILNFLSLANPHKEDNILWQLVGRKERKYPTKDLEELDSHETREMLLELLHDWDNPSIEVIKQSEIMFPRSLFELEEDSNWSKDRVVLIGDAAHTADPLYGQGTAWALEDGMYLAKMLYEYTYQDAFYFYEFDRKKMIDRVSKIEAGDYTRTSLDEYEEAFNYSIEWINEG